jgi:very-short-patch-repair endonuclease
VDAAAWMGTDRGAQAVLAAGVQQRMVRVSDLVAALERNERLYRRKIIRQTLGDIAGGAHALSELDFTTLVVRRFKLPEPDRQVRRDERGCRRWLDALWEEARLVVEIDGAGHIDALTYWDDMNRGNSLQLGHYRVLRFPSWVVRYQPDYVAVQMRQALREAGYSC